jgi:hypothetical protein
MKDKIRLTKGKSAKNWAKARISAVLPMKRDVQPIASWLTHRTHGRTRLQTALWRGFALFTLLALTLTAFPWQTVDAAANITGTVYADFNASGNRDNATGATAGIAADVGVGGVTVRAFDAAGSNCATTTSAAGGTYTLNMAPCTGTTFRVEFSTLPTGYAPAQVGTANATTTQFVNEGGTANLGINKPGDFCQNNPTIVTTCAHPEDAVTGPNAALAVLQGSPYNSSGTAASTLTGATTSQIGAAHGLAFRRSDRSVYSSAFMKRHVGFGPSGPGAIYKSGAIPATGSGTVSSSLFVTIPNAGTDPHPVADNNCNSQDGQVSPLHPSGQCWLYDTFSFSAVGKRSLGDIEMYEDPANSANDALFVVNLNNRNLYKVTGLNGSPTVQAPITMPLALPGATQGCPSGDVRPFALAIQDGVGYAGLTCSAQTSGLAADLTAYIYTFNPVTGVFGSSPILEAPLDYPRSCAVGCTLQAEWQPWIDTFSVPPIELDEPTDPVANYPQPVLSDITFGTNGSMAIGIRDRFGDQMGHGTFNPDDINDPELYEGNGPGDILRACLVGATWTLENAGTCDGQGPGPGGINSADPLSGQGPGGFEFYPREADNTTSGPPVNHDELTSGGLVSVPGYNEVMTTVYDPLPWSGSFPDPALFTGGTRTFNSNSGSQTNAHQIYEDDPSNLGKANGLGDLEALCDQAPLEIGNRIWKDTNSNGVQDAGEPPIAGVTVNLYNATNTLVATTLTDSNGNFIFSNRTVDESGNPLTDSTGKTYNVTGLLPNTTDFQLRLDNPADYGDPNKLQGLFLTIPTSTQDNGNNQNDSEATLSGAGAPSSSNPPIITFAAGAAGNNNHTYDFGFVLEAVTPPVTPPATPSSSSGSGGLAGTGQSQLWFAVLAIVIIGGAGTSLIRRRQTGKMNRLH